MRQTDAERQRKHRLLHPETETETVRDRVTAHEGRMRLKAQVLTHYGHGKLSCVKCGESRLACLSIDHISGGGCKQRYHTVLRSSTAFYRWLIREGLPVGYQTLCMNCQFVKRFENHEEHLGTNKPVEFCTKLII